jgi:hypothetical protein
MKILSFRLSGVLLCSDDRIYLRYILFVNALYQL